jgi:glycosyltransferase involved in cell wall biosynthesis
MRVLFVVPYAPNPVRVRPYEFISTLVKREHSVTLATVWTSAAEENDLAYLRGLGVTVIAEAAPAWRSLVNSLGALPTHTPLQAVYSWRPSLLRAIEAELADKTTDAIHVEHLRGSRYGLELLKYLQRNRSHPRPPIIWDSVDCISYLFQQAAQSSRSLKGRLMTRLELERTRRYEAELVRQFDRTVVTSSVDRQALLDLPQPIQNANSADGNTPDQSALANRIYVVPNGVDLGKFSFKNTAERAPARIIFSGKMSYHANVTAAMFLVQEIMPLVWARRPEAEVWLVGKDPSPELRALATAETPGPDAKPAGSRRVVVTGFVPDIAPFIQTATVAVAPLIYGAGIQNKVLEALACGTPVVVTPQICASLDLTPGRELVAASTPQEFADAILHLLESPELRATLAETGRAFVESKHSWHTAAAHLEELYCAAAAERQTM